MSSREIIMLGTASQSPTRHRNHNGYALRWDERLVFFDPGEGFQRQCILAGVAIARADAVCLTHFHGDHCLGLPGLIARRGADDVTDPLHIWFPAAGLEFYERLRTCTDSFMETPLLPHPIDGPGPVGELGDLTITALPLRHRIPTFGYRLQESDRRSFDRAELASRGISGPDVGRLQQLGEVESPTGRVTLDDVSSVHPGQSMAFVMDTAVCDSIAELAADVDLLVIESTFLSADERLAEEYHHLTAEQAGQLAAGAGARRVVLTHFSQRYGDTGTAEQFRIEASRHHPDVHAADDFDVIAVPPRSLSHGRTPR